MLSHALFFAIALAIPLLPGPSVHEMFLARTLEWVSFPLSEDFPNLVIELISPALQASSLLLSRQGSP